MDKKELYDSLLEAIDNIESHILIIVEGKHDIVSLRELNIDNSILALEGRPLYKVVERVVKMQKKVLILVDLDKKGRIIYRYLYHHLTRHGIKVNTVFRDFLIRKTTIHQIEDIYRYVKKHTLKLRQGL